MSSVSDNVLLQILMNIVNISYFSDLNTYMFTLLND